MHLWKTREQWEEVLKEPGIDGIYVSMSLFSEKTFLSEVFETVEEASKREKECFLTLPYVLREGKMDGKEAEIQKIAKKVDGFLVRNLEELGYLRDLGLIQKAIGDYSLYSFNEKARDFLWMKE